MMLPHWLIDILSQRFVADAYTLCDKAACANFVAAICCTNSNQFEFVRQIAATKFCRSDNDFHVSHEAICCSNLSQRRVAAICRIVCLDLYTTIQNAAARINTFTKKTEHITPVLRKLHWLPVQYRIIPVSLQRSERFSSCL